MSGRFEAQTKRLADFIATRVNGISNTGCDNLAEDILRWLETDRFGKTYLKDGVCGSCGFVEPKDDAEAAAMAHAHQVSLKVETANLARELFVAAVTAGSGFVERDPRGTLKRCFDLAHTFVEYRRSEK